MAHTRRAFLTLTALAGGVLPLAAQPPAAAPAQPPAQPAAPQGPERWEKNIATFEETDRKTPPPTNPVLFVGSSSIVGWKTLKTDFPQYPTLNRGFGGSIIEDSTFYAARVILPYKPRAIVFYAGDNDIGRQHKPERVRDDFATFVQKVRDGGLTETPVFFIAIKPSISRWKYRTEIMTANRLIRDWAEVQPGGKVVFVDVWTPMLGPNGEPRPELYVKDGLHMTPAGYAVWKDVLTPILTARVPPEPSPAPPTAPQP